eukprot:3789669-Rhodomonas_salina.1
MSAADVVLLPARLHTVGDRRRCDSPENQDTRRCQHLGGGPPVPETPSAGDADGVTAQWAGGGGGKLDGEAAERSFKGGVQAGGETRALNLPRQDARGDSRALFAHKASALLRSKAQHSSALQTSAPHTLLLSLQDSNTL